MKHAFHICSYSENVHKTDFIKYGKYIIDLLSAEAKIFTENTQQNISLPNYCTRGGIYSKTQ